MKAVFLCESPENVRRVFAGESAKRLAAAGVGEKVYSKSDVLAQPEKFRGVETVFSTWGMPVFTEDEIAKYLPSLKYVFYGAGSVQPFARPFLARGVRVFSAWAANAVPVAEMTVAQIVLANKGYYVSGRLLSSGNVGAAREAFAKCRGNYGETVGIIGAGMIGKLVIAKLKEYRLRVIVFDPFLPDEKAKELGCEKCSLEELFSQAFVISNHLANNAGTKGMLGYDLFKLMRENAVFINTGRGAQVVEDGLVRILSERPDLTALLDVTYPEPPEEGHPFYALENCFLTPHIAGSAGDEVRRMGEYTVSEYEAVAGGKAARYEVTAEMLKTMA